MAFKSLIDRIRSKPEWQHDDPAIRAEAVLRLPAGESDLVAQIAREDGEARVRRAAVKKLADTRLLGEIARSDADEGVRHEAAGHLAALVVHGQDAEHTLAALALVADPRHLAEVARLAGLESVRHAAIGRLTDAKALAAVVRDSPDAGSKLLALHRIDDPAALVGIAQKSELRAVALAAVERLRDLPSLEAVAAKAKLPAAVKRARARIAEARGPEAEVVAAPNPLAALPPIDDDAERAAYERERDRLARETAVREEARDARVALCERLEAVGAADGPRAADEAREAWAALPALPGTEGDELSRRFADAVGRCGERHAAFVAAEARRGELEALCVRAEAAVEVTDLEAANAAMEPVEAAWKERALSDATPDDLRARWSAVLGRMRGRRDEVRTAESHKAQENHTRLLALTASLEARAKDANLSLRDADHAVREARTALDNPGPLPTKRDREALLARIEAARKAIRPRLADLREEADWKRWANVDVQEELCRRAEALLEEKNLEKAALEVRDLDLRWKQAKEAPKEKAEDFWTRFKAARDEVRARCDAFFAKRAEEHAVNLRAKEALCERAEALSDSTEWLKTTEALKALQAEWKAVGPTAHGPSKAAWERFRKACDRFFVRRDEDRTKRREDSKKNLEDKRALCEKAEALSGSTDWESTAAELKKLQAEWKQVGPVRPSDSEAIWKRFRAAADLFFERFKRRGEIAESAAVEAREALCVEIEGLGDAGPEGLADKVVALQASWRQAPAVPALTGSALTTRFVKALGVLVEAHPSAFAGTDLDPEAGLTRLEKLCVRVEAARASAEPDAEPAADLATRLREALATNTMGGQAAAEAKWREATTEVESAQAAFQRLYPVPGERGEALRARFEAGLKAFFEARPDLPERKAEAPRREARSRGEGRPRSSARGHRSGGEARPRSG